MGLPDGMKLRHAASVLIGFLSAACSSAPPYSGWTPDQLYAHGEQAFQEGDWGEARRAFERLVLTFPGYERAVDARHYLAQAFYRDAEYLSAVSEFTRIVQVYPDHERVAEAWMGLCRSYASMSPHPQRDQQYTMQARTTCQNVANDFRGTAVGDSASAVMGRMHTKLAEKAYGEGHFYFQRDIYESAELVFLDVVELYAQTDVAPRATMRLIEIYDEWGWDEQKAEFTSRLLERYPDSPEARSLREPTVADSGSVVRSRAPPPLPGRASSSAWAPDSA